jgi:hypothetical protein
MSKWLPVWMIPLVLAGCGGDGKRPEPELTGQLQGGHVQGVEWRTPTRSGVTDANGRFTYLAGEMVSFSLGATQLGAAPGSTDMTLFTLAGLTPPTTERALRRELDRAMRSSTPFARAINLDPALIALDADANPDNGIDVRNRGAALQGVVLRFDQRLEDFGFQLYWNVASLTQSVPLFKPVAHLYSSLGLRVPVHAPSRIETDSTWLPAPGVRTYAYYANGLTKAVDDDRDGDGVVDSRETYVFDGFGRLTNLGYTADNDLDHVDDQAYATAYQYDSRGTVTGVVDTTSANASGMPATYRVVAHDVDALARTTRQVVETDTGSDGTVDSRDVTTAEYQAPFDSVFTTTTDSNNDGVVDYIARSTELRDTRRRVLSRVHETDSDANGVIDSIRTETYVYDDAVRTMRAVSEVDVNGDGAADVRTVSTWRLDRAGNVIAQTDWVEPSADGVVSLARSVSSEYDDARRVTRSTRDEDSNGDGTPESRQLDATTYDDVGNVTFTTSDFDDGLAGHIDGHYDEGSEYGADGELLASAAHLDLDGDGLTDIRAGQTVGNIVVEDGVTLLADWYFRTRFSGFQ